MLSRAAISAAASLAVVLALPACGPVEESAGPPGAVVYVAPPPEPRRNPTPSPEVHHWLAASDSVRRQLDTLRSELATLQQLHVENHFDDFLQLDPATLDPAQLYYLYHFLSRGYFRVEREVLLQLLESRRDRAGAPAPDPSSAADIPSRLQLALQRDETLLIDLETAIARYKAPGDEDFPIPRILDQKELAAMRTEVARLLALERIKLDELDRRIAALRPPL